MRLMTIKLLTSDGAVFRAEIAHISDVSGVRFRGRHFFFRNLKPSTLTEGPCCEFEEGRVITLVDSEVTQEGK